jgi:hypothetical protein
MSDLEIKDLALPEYWNTYLASILPVGRSNLRSGISDISLKTVISNFQDIKVNGSLNIRHLEADINKVTVAGDYKLDGNITFTSKKPSSTTYKLSLEFNKANIITDKTA